MHAMIVVFVLAAVIYSGIGGFALQMRDYEKHNAVLRDLIEYSWPTGYASDRPNDPGVFAYYIGYYLPAAVAGKAGGFRVAEWFQYLWSCVGVWLSIALFMRLVGKTSIVTAFAFLFFGGLDVVGQLLSHRWLGSLGTGDFWIFHQISKDESLAKMFLVYLSHYVQLQWVPHNCIGAWIASGLFLSKLGRSEWDKHAPVIGAVMLLWSPFVALGLLPFAVLHVLARLRDQGWHAVGHLLGWEFVLGSAIGLIVLLFLLSNNGTPHGFLWEFQDLRAGWLLLLCFYAIEFGAYLPVLFLLRKTLSKSERCVLGVAVAVLVLLPLYHLGFANDFVNKTGIPALFVLAVSLFRVVLRGLHLPRLRRVAITLVAVLAIGTWGSISGLLAGYLTGLKVCNPSALTSAPHCNELVQKYSEEAPYMGNGNAFFWKYLARPLVLSKHQ